MASTTGQVKVAPSAASPTPTPSAIPSTVLTIGDSVMKGYGVAPGSSWLELLAQEKGWTVFNRSCNGAGFIHVAVADCHTTLTGVISSAAGLSPRYILIAGSANDFGTNNAKLNAVTTQAFASLRAEFPTARIIALRLAWGDRSPPGKVAIIDAQMRTAVTAVHGDFVDFGAPLLGHPELMQADHLHPNASGQLVLKSAIESALAKLGIVI